MSEPFDTGQTDMEVPSSIRTATSYVEVLSAAVDDLHRKVANHWREVVCRAILDSEEPTGEHHFPTSMAPLGEAYRRFERNRLWDYRHPFARIHLTGGGHCAYVAWVQGGQPGQLRDVRCDGATGTRAGEPLTHPRTGETLLVPRRIECGMGSILRQVDVWAWHDGTCQLVDTGADPAGTNGGPGSPARPTYEKATATAAEASLPAPEW